MVVMIEALAIFAIVVASVTMLAHFFYTIGKDKGYSDGCYAYRKRFPHSVNILRKIPTEEDRFYVDICAMFADKNHADLFINQQSIVDEHNKYIHNSDRG